MGPAHGCWHRELALCRFPHIDRDPALKPNPIKIVETKRQHRFDYEKGLCYREELSEGKERK